MKQIIASRTLVIPEGVDITVKSRQVHVKGPRGDPTYLVSSRADAVQDTTSLLN